MLSHHLVGGFMAYNMDTSMEHMDPLTLLKLHEAELRTQFGVEKIGIFGSFARGEERIDSDVDVLVTFKDGQKTFEHYRDCKFYLEDLFGRTVDLVIESAVKYHLKPYIFSEIVYA